MASSNTEAAMRTRIVNHMNKDHKAELSRYLRHSAKVPAHLAKSPVMKEISLENMTIQSDDGALHLVPFEPPMRSYADARKRAVEMDSVARQALGLGDVDINQYAPPTGFGLFVFCAVIFYFYCFFSLPWQVPGSVMHSFWEGAFPGGVKMQAWVVRLIFIPVVGIHVSEAMTLDRSRLQKFGVQRGSRLWWAWMVTCFFEGLPAFWRFDEMVKETRDIRKKAL
ncbi:related to integral membrane protein [Cephalotrichum gorgonifer]|uniref:Related to integral membrane protein n=1 Tax=Cephalotrichum gorgonifer TaxID=2041049 RepID=A0AAE8SX11_9PEZI|nr:related to integral membrane protein [Cephalotrichum gorgonifer]